jgi:hypothetical protein
MTKLSALVHELESKITQNEKLNTAVSQKSVGWHIQHSLLVGLQIINAVEKSNHENYKWKFNLNRSFVYTLNKIPRGKGKAPESVKPSVAFNIDDLNKDFQLLKTRLHVLNDLHPSSYFKHPYFGDLNLKATVKMLEIHTRHHLDIINDIIRG